MASKFGGGASVCNVCEKKVYANESVQLDAATRIHRACFRCANDACRTTLTKRFTVVQGKYYCEPHGMQLLSDEAPAATTSVSASASASASAASSAKEIVNRTGGIELGGTTLYGVDAETALRRLENYDLAFEMEARQWIEAVLGEKLDGDTLGDALKNGVALCRLLNVIKPGTVAKINKKPIAMMELENVRMFLQGCWALGVPSGSLFTSNDLYKLADMTSVLQTLLALGRIAQTIPTFKGPHFGQKQSGAGATRKFAPVDTSYLSKTFVQSTESGDAAVLRAQLVKLEDLLKRERFQRALLEEQIKAGGGGAGAADATNKLMELRSELDATEAKRAQLANEVARMTETTTSLQAELEWERTKDMRTTKVELHTIGSDGGVKTNDELAEEVASLEHAVKMLAQKRKTDVQKIREVTSRFEEATKRVDELTTRIATLESELRESRERLANSEQNAQSLMARLEDLAHRPIDDVPEVDGVEVGAGDAVAVTVADTRNGDDASEAERAAAEAERVTREAREAEIREILIALLGSGPQVAGETVDWEQDPLVDAQDVRELVEHFVTDEGRRLFIKVLDDTLHVCKARELDKKPFELLVEIFHALLTEMSRENVDFIGAHVVMDAACQLYCANGDERDFVQNHVRGHALWSSRAFWSDHFWTEMLKTLRASSSSSATAASFEVKSGGSGIRRVTPGASQDMLSPRLASNKGGQISPRLSDRSGATSPPPVTVDDEDLQIDPDDVVGMLGVTANKMLQWGAGLREVELFAAEICDQLQLDISEAIQQKLHVQAALVEMEQQRLARKKKLRRSRAESLLQPSTIRRSRGAGQPPSVVLPDPMSVSATTKALPTPKSSTPVLPPKKQTGTSLVKH